ncbi:MAG: hypothetical protein GWP08_00595 [Nitrospiraceae bacterium]|nr:hypothetical protein [Nitrospiraceae bacterium]
MSSSDWTAAGWAARVEQPDARFREHLTDVYGEDAAVIAGRLELLRAVLARFLERYGDQPVRIFRSPGRINLRGMHVDTHGGYLNLMTHQREVVAVAAPADDAVTFANTDPQFEETSFALDDFASHPALGNDWLAFITSTEARAAIEAQRGHWSHYMKGCWLSIRNRFSGERLSGVQGVIGSNIPRGAALSSSAALCTAVCLTMLGLNARRLDDESLILAARDAEWYTGSRCGVSDQAAMVLGGPGQVVNVALDAARLDTSTARRQIFPDALRVLVVNSYTERSLSGAALVAYTVNRFAYSLAIEIVRQEARAQGAPADLAARMKHLSDLSPTLFERGFLMDLLRSVPESLSLDDLRRRYDLPGLDAAYAQCFGGVPPEDRPTRIALRGPLLFGIAESERARLFSGALAEGCFDEAGALMTAGHDGDRRVAADGTPYRYDVSDAAIERLIERGTSIECCPGAYGASSPVLDALVDAALEAGALGASLTGAGIAGTVLALCRAEDADTIAQAVCDRMKADDYAALASRGASLSEAEIAEAVVVNTATAKAGELVVA